MHKTIESTDLMLQMVAAGRGVAGIAALAGGGERGARWRLHRCGWARDGVPKQIHLGLREADRDTAYVRAFIELARGA